MTRVGAKLVGPAQAGLRGNQFRSVFVDNATLGAQELHAQLAGDRRTDGQPQHPGLVWPNVRPRQAPFVASELPANAKRRQINHVVAVLEAYDDAST